MAGDWIKWVKGLSKRPEVLDIASALQVSRREAASLCCEVWEWADDNVDPGDETDECPGFVRMRSASCHTIDGLAGVAGLADAMVAVGWLEVRNGSVMFPRFGRHNGKHAKRRILDAERQRTKRQGKRTNVRTESGSEADKSVTREEESFNSKSNSPPPTRKAVWEESGKLISAWNSTPGTRYCPGEMSLPPQDLGARVTDNDWLEMYPKALAMFPLKCLEDRDSKMDLWKFLEEETVGKILNGRYDFTTHQGKSRGGKKNLDIDAALEASKK